MHRQILIDCLPYLGLLLASIAAAWGLVRLAGGRWHWAGLRGLHRDELGGVQSLSFVLTLPLLMMVLMFIVQLSQITIGKIVVEYAAFAAARSAMVWIPSNLGTLSEGENQIGTLVSTGAEVGGAGVTWHGYQVQPSDRKSEKIRHAAAMAMMPVCPSRSTGSSGGQGAEAAGSMLTAYLALSPAAGNNPRIATRLQNKLSYALAHTRVTIEVRHKEDNVELPLAHYDIQPLPWEYAPNEIGWQDQVTVSVEHDFALLPGPARVLFRRATARPGTSPEEAPGSDSVARKISRQQGVYTYPLNATVRLSNEGEKSVLAFVQTLGGFSPQNNVNDSYDYNPGDDDTNYDDAQHEDENEGGGDYQNGDYQNGDYQDGDGPDMSGDNDDTPNDDEPNDDSPDDDTPNDDKPNDDTPDDDTPDGNVQNGIGPDSFVASLSHLERLVLASAATDRSRGSTRALLYPAMQPHELETTR